MPKPIDFPQVNTLYRGDNAEIGDLPCYRDSQQTISCWELTPDELQEITRNGGKIYLSQMNFLAPLQPQAIWATSPFEATDAEKQ